MSTYEMTSVVTIDDLKYHELRKILSYLSVRQLFSCLTVNQKWYQIINELLNSQKVLSLKLNDINFFTNEELNKKCEDCHHLAINSSVGGVVGKKSGITPFIRPYFHKIAENFFKLFEFCPNIKSLDLNDYYFQLSDIDILFSRCPQLECLSITSDETKWTNFLCPQVLRIKHFCISLATKTPIYGVHEKPLEFLEYQNTIHLEDLRIINAKINSAILNILGSYIKIISPKLKTFHFNSKDKMNESEALNLINSFQSINKSVVNNFDLNIFTSEQLLEAIDNILPNVETLYLHINIESQLNDSLKNLKNLRKLHLDFDSNINMFGFGGLHSDNDCEYNLLLPKLPTNLQKLVVYDASLSLPVFAQTSYYLPKLEELELIIVIIDNEFQQNFWQIISNFKYLQKLRLNHILITDDGINHLVNSESLRVLELVNYKGVSAVETQIDSMKVIEVFSLMASLKPNDWFDLRLDISVIEITQDIKRLVPRNLRLVSVGYKK